MEKEEGKLNTKKHTAKKIYQNEFGVKVIFRAGTG
jgi:hypothetical protein